MHIPNPVHPSSPLKHMVYHISRDSIITSNVVQHDGIGRGWGISSLHPRLEFHRPHVYIGMRQHKQCANKCLYESDHYAP